MPPNAGKANPNREGVVKAVGEYRWFCLLLANFNPCVADQIHNNPADKIAEAYLAKTAYEYVEPENK